jgi:hypothetical protein
MANTKILIFERMRVIFSILSAQHHYFMNFIVFVDDCDDERKTFFSQPIFTCIKKCIRLQCKFDERISISQQNPKKRERKENKIK